MESFFPRNKVVRVGNLIRPSFFLSEKIYFPNEANKNLKSVQNKSLLILGGSQGASSINRFVSVIAKNLVDENIKIRWQTGSIDYEELKNKFSNSCNIEIYPYINDIKSAYLSADLVLARAGAMTISELASLARSAILVPFPYAAANHQAKNAKVLDYAGAAIIINESDSPSKILSVVVQTISSPVVLKGLAENIRQFGSEAACTTILHDIRGLLNEQSRKL